MRILTAITCSLLIATQGLAAENSLLILPSKNGKVTLNHLKHQRVNKGCRACHENGTGGRIKELSMTWAHKKCMGCHDAHGSAYPMQVKQSPGDLCLGCHETIKDSTTAVYKHPAALGDRACLTCHTAHGGNLARLMSDLPVRICMTCHDKEIKMQAGGVVAAVAEVNDPTTFKHAPIRDGQALPARFPEPMRVGSGRRRAGVKVGQVVRDLVVGRVEGAVVHDLYGIAECGVVRHPNDRRASRDRIVDEREQAIDRRKELG